MWYILSARKRSKEEKIASTIYKRIFVFLIPADTRSLQNKTTSFAMEMKCMYKEETKGEMESK